jgi:hypothetical protein
LCKPFLFGIRNVKKDFSESLFAAFFHVFFEVVLFKLSGDLFKQYFMYKCETEIKRCFKYVRLILSIKNVKRFLVRVFSSQSVLNAIDGKSFS